MFVCIIIANSKHGQAQKRASDHLATRRSVVSNVLCKECADESYALLRRPRQLAGQWKKPKRAILPDTVEQEELASYRQIIRRCPRRSTPNVQQRRHLPSQLVGVARCCRQLASNQCFWAESLHLYTCVQHYRSSRNSSHCTIYSL